MKKCIALLLSMLVLYVAAIPALASDTDTALEKQTIKVAICADYAPFAYFEKGELKGFDVDLIKCIAERLNMDVLFLKLDFDEVFAAVSQDAADCGVSALTITEERERIVDCSTPYMKAKVTMREDGAEALVSHEEYAIVFNEGALGEAESLGSKMNNVLMELRDDRTLFKLMEKHGLNEVSDDGFMCIEYSEALSGGDPRAETEDTEGNVSATSVPCSDWAEEAVQKASVLTITDKGANYNYPAPITREAFCRLIYNYVHIITDGVTYDSENIPFSDTQNPEITMLHAMGIVKGKGADFFAPAELLTREEAATILFRLIDAVHSDWAAHELYYMFADSAEISDWAMPSIQRICNMGIMQGVDNNNFAPQQYYTTEQAITTLVRVYSGFEASRYQPADEFLLCASDGATYKLNSDIKTIKNQPITQKEGRGDGFHWLECTYDDASVKALIAEDSSSNIIRIETASDVCETYRGIKVGDSLPLLQEKYPEHLTKALSDDICYVFEPPITGFNRIYFYLENDTITKIVIENGIDG